MDEETERTNDAGDAKEDKLLTAVEAAKELGVSRATLYTNYINTKMLVPAPSVLRQPKRRFSFDDVKRLKDEETARRRAEQARRDDERG